MCHPSGRACLLALRVPRVAPSRTTPVHIFPPRILEIAGPRGRKGAGVCLLTELGGRARDAAKAAFADDGSLRTKIRQFLSDPWTRANPQPGPALAKRGDSKRPGGGGERAPLSSCCFSFPDSLWALATKKVRGAGAGLRLVPFCSANPICESPFGRGQTGLPRRGPASACGAAAWVLQSLVPQQPQLRHLQPRLFHPELLIEPAEQLWLLAQEQRPPWSSRLRDAGASPGCGGAPGLQKPPGLGCGHCSLVSQTLSAFSQRAGRLAPDRPPTGSQRSGQESGVRSSRKSFQSLGTVVLTDTKRKHRLY